MKLLRYGNPGEEKPGLLAPDGSLRDLSSEIPDVAGDALLPETIERLRSIDPNTLSLVSGEPRLGACVSGTGKFICIGLNYARHARESGMEVPAEPVVFMKATSSIIGPNDDVEIPRGSTKTDWEVELGVVIGRTAKYVSEADALSHVAGYCVVNDVSEREWQLEGTGQWVKGKACDTFGPVGPWLVTPDEVPDPQGLTLWLDLDGQRIQDSDTGDMIFSVAFIIHYLSKFMSLLPGDIITTGTPAGVGMGFKPPTYLVPGQSMELSVDGLGVQRQRVIAG
jgi:2-keto-4-pentenoate hydratase/2-oxohepta-3-ene-1,7-dioic acid hydratase in catechol pathway